MNVQAKPTTKKQRAAKNAIRAVAKAEDKRLVKQMQKTRIGNGRRANNVVYSVPRTPSALRRARKNAQRNSSNFRAPRRQVGGVVPGGLVPGQGVRSGLRGLKGKVLQIAAAISLPGSEPPVRWADQFNSEKTAVAKPYELVPLAWNEGQADAMLPLTDMVFISFRSALRRAVYYDASGLNAGGPGANYELFFGNPGSSTTPNFDIPPNTPDSVPLPVAYALASTEYQPHSDTLFMLQNKDYPELRWFWMNAQDTVTLNISASTGSTGLITLWAYISGVTKDVQDATIISTTTQVSLGAVSALITPAYYALSASCTGSVNYHITSGNLAIPADCWCHLPVSGLARNLGRIQSSIVLAASHLIENGTPIQSNGGFSVTAQTGTNTHWYQLATFDAYTNVSQLEGAEPMTFTKGLYTFLVPSSIDELKQQNEFNFNPSQGGIVSSYGSVDELSEYVITVIRIPSGTTSTVQAKIDTGIMFASNDVFTDTKTSEFTIDECNKAVSTLKKMRVVYENPSHLEDIWSQIKGFASKVAQGIDFVAPVLGSAVDSLTALF